MAEINTVIAEASQDLQTIEDFVNLPADSEVYPRLLPSVNVGTLAGTRQAIFEAGGLPATPFDTLNDLQSSQLADGDYGVVMNDAAEKNGYYKKDGGQFTLLDFGRVESKILEFSQNSDILTPKRLLAESDLNDFTSHGVYIKYSSQDITNELNYPVNFAGLLEVYAADDEYTTSVQKYTVFHTGDKYTRRNTEAGWSEWVADITGNNIGTISEPHFENYLNNKSLLRMSKPLEWIQVTGSSISYISGSVVISGSILASSNIVSAGRILITDISVPISGTYDVCYIDLDKLKGSDGKITAANQSQYIFVGSYTGGVNSFRNEPNKIPLFKMNRPDWTVRPCSGFPPIVKDEPVKPSVVDSYLQPLEFTKSVGALTVYIPMPSGKKLSVGLTHTVVDDSDLTIGRSNSNLWRLYTAYRCSDNLSRELLLVNTGEWELALKHSEDTRASGIDKDFVGGYHGDEVLSSALFYVDGVLRQANFTTGGTARADSIQFMQKSTIFFQNTTRPLAEHIKVITFTKDGVNIKQKLDFKYETLDLTATWTNMLPILREQDEVLVTEKSSRSNEHYLQVDDNSVGGFDTRTTPIYDGTSIKQWSESTGVSTEVVFNKTVGFFETQGAFISGSDSYNKLYSSAIDPVDFSPKTVQLGDVWEWDTDYIIKC